MIKFDSSNSKIIVDYQKNAPKLKSIIASMEDGSALGSAFLGWNKQLLTNDFEEIEQIYQTASFLESKAKTMLVLGIGGSYLGSLAIDQALNGKSLSKAKRLLYAGYDISSENFSEIYEYCQNNDFVINVISKSGTTLETAVSYRLFKKLLIDKYGENKWQDYVVITTDQKTGALRQIANEQKIKSFVIPHDIGGRYSVFSAVGLLPLAFVDIDIKALLEGATLAAQDCFKVSGDNAAFAYALNRFEQYNNGLSVEALVVYNQNLRFLIEWYKQLFAESEGKNKKGLFPTGLVYSTDLHSVGQFVQDGSTILFETIIKFKKTKQQIMIPYDKDDYDNLNRLTEYSLADINEKIITGAIEAHSHKGDVSNYVIELECLDEKNLGYLMAFMMYACAYSAYLLEVNPFDQPGVEVYKKEISKLL